MWWACNFVFYRYGTFGSDEYVFSQSLMSRFNVQGFPTILVFGADKENPTPYEGARTASGIESFAIKELETNVAPPEVTELTGPVSVKSLFSTPNRYTLHRLKNCVKFSF